MPPYKSYARVLIDPGSDPKFLPAVTGCLDALSAMPDGDKLLRKISDGKHDVTIKQGTGINSCASTGAGAPPLTCALEDNNQALFRKALAAAFDNAKRGGLTLEHFAKQLKLGLTPASYSAKKNVVPPTAPPGRQLLPEAVTRTVQLLQDLASGAAPLAQLPMDWDYDLPRLLRNYMTPGAGCPCTVNFDPTGTFHCRSDPAMNKRPPAIGLAHELIHALHGVQGTKLSFVTSPSGHSLEEVVTTGLPPYNSEELSDNKIRTQWPANLELRTKYGN